MLLGRGRAARRRGLPRARGCYLSDTLGLSYQVPRVWSAKPGTAVDGGEPAVCRLRRTPINVRKPSYNGLVFDGYQYYALAAAFADSSEAAYKLVDMCSRGKFVERDMAKAYQL